LDIDTINYDALVDIRSVKIDKTLPRNEKIADFVRQIKNPYCYKCGKVTVIVNFSDTSETLEDRLKGYLSSL